MTSLNTDIWVEGRQIHVQTEDWGPVHRWIVTQVFEKGALIKTFRLDYDTLTRLGAGMDPQQWVRWQHHLILDQIQKGLLGVSKNFGLT